ncbi:hypothetical protein [Pseudomonas putida]|uniref:hypothetical protein n=1 Tax=Pseudomonas TaxID=286 RepID=UPI003467B9FD
MSIRSAAVSGLTFIKLLRRGQHVDLDLCQSRRAIDGYKQGLKAMASSRFQGAVPGERKVDDDLLIA